MTHKLRTFLGSMAAVAALAAPAAAQEACGVAVFFENGQMNITPAAAAVIRQFTMANPDAVLTVNGYASSPGSAASNLTLSQRRASNVAATLQAQGESIASATGFGESIRPGATGPEDATNRRVEIVREDCGNPVAAIDNTTGLAIAGGIGVLALIAAVGGDDDGSGGGTGGTAGTGGTSGTGGGS